MARAIFIPFSMAFRVGLSPIFPDTATRMMSFSLFEQISSKPSVPKSVCIPSIFISLFEHTYFGRNLSACCFSKSMLEPPVNAIISNLS